ncbi:hypothetical protein [Serratia rhizosphaerae]|uniref:hypothetical protein n=1 Tax=Serratia rhizosphaerae TaxID=2597702 RepID=UPI001EBD5C5E|nr:hypothetical protein [Serratia rhizosphaerae]MBU3892796.1 hypothetical protein [Serratia rubidaea]MEB6334604.1 hypothetical protein [Serratia rhizosphaerae]
MLINELMKNQLQNISWGDVEVLKLPHELDEIVSLGFLEVSGCFLSKKLFEYCKNNSLHNFEDEIAFECFVNSMHIDDYVSEKYLQYSIVFCNSIIKKWNESHYGKLNVIISLDDETLLPTVKFHSKRKGVSWLDEDNLELSIQPILVTTNELKRS